MIPLRLTTDRGWTTSLQSRPVIFVVVWAQMEGRYLTQISPRLDPIGKFLKLSD
jgi:hypothetical protein